MAVSDNERKIDNLRRENERWREKLHELQMQQADADNPAKKQGAVAPELAALDTKLASLRRQCEKAEDLNKRVQLVNDQVVAWTSRIA
jgi:chromosome segregation ATPase